MSVLPKKKAVFHWSDKFWLGFSQPGESVRGKWLRFLAWEARSGSGTKKTKSQTQKLDLGFVTTPQSAKRVSPLPVVGRKKKNKKLPQTWGGRFRDSTSISGFFLDGNSLTVQRRLTSGFRSKKTGGKGKVLPIHWSPRFFSVKNPWTGEGP